MVEATLAFARDEAASEAAREGDLAALVEGVCEDLRELGREVAVAPGPRLVARVRPLALRRALRNLVENAVAYGGRARVTLRRGGGGGGGGGGGRGAGHPGGGAGAGVRAVRASRGFALARDRRGGAGLGDRPLGGPRPR